MLQARAALGLIFVVGCSSTSQSQADVGGQQQGGTGSVEGTQAIPVTWVGELLPRGSDGQISLTIAMLADTDLSGFCTESPDPSYMAPASRFVAVGVVGPPATGTFNVADSGPGVLSVQQRYADAGSQTLAVATSGTITLTYAATDRLVGSFDVQALASGTGTTSQLTGTFDAPFCAYRK